MAKMRIHFTNCDSAYEGTGSKEPFLRASVMFDIFLDDRKLTPGPFHTVAKLPVGSSSSTDALEVEVPNDANDNSYTGPFDYERFRKAVATYYQKVIASQDLLVPTKYRKEWDDEFDVENPGPGW